jgi:hypothetical protein
MQKYFVAYIFLWFPITSFALTCPNNATILDYGESIQQVITECGTPKSQKQYLRTVRTIQPLVDPTGDDVSQAYSVSDQHQSFSIVTRNGRPYKQHCTSIMVGDNYTTSNCTNSGVDIQSPFICEQITRTGDATTSTVYPCGNPPPVTVLENITVTEFTYDASSPDTLIFENAKLSGWK